MALYSGFLVSSKSMLLLVYLIDQILLPNDGQHAFNEFSFPMLRACNMSIFEASVFLIEKLMYIFIYSSFLSEGQI